MEGEKEEEEEGIVRDCVCVFPTECMGYVYSLSVCVKCRSLPIHNLPFQFNCSLNYSVAFSLQQQISKPFTRTNLRAIEGLQFNTSQIE